MALTNYSTLLTSIADWLDRDDITTVSETWVDLAEARIYRELRHSFMESALSVAISSGTAALPADFLELKVAYLTTTPATPLQIRNADWIYARYPQRTADGVPCFIATEQDAFLFGPYPDSNYTIAGTYYAKPDPLVTTTNETNWLTTNAPDMLLYGSLVHSAPYIGHDQRAPLWEAAYQDALRRVQNADKREDFPLSMPLRQIPA